MAAVEYKMFFNNKAADQERLDKFEEIVVEQEVDVMWEARLQMPVCVDKAGHWEGEDEDFVQPSTRVRVEVKVGEGSFVPLIDGTITQVASPRHPQPGRSSVTLVVHDDSELLDTEDTIARFEDKTDSEIAQQIFSEVLTGTPDIEDTAPQPDNPSTVVIQRGTQMQILRALARRQGMHAYVLPGGSPGQSIGAFKNFATQADPDLPTLVLLGDDGNLASFHATRHARRPSNVRAATLSIKDKTITTSSATPADATLMGDAPAVAADSKTPTLMLPPGHNDIVDLDSRTRGEASKLSLATEATGSVLPFCYKGVLRPYRVVPVNVSDSNLSVNYLITKVTHKLNRETYEQSFTVKGNAVSTGASGAAGLPQAAAKLSVGINVQGSIF